MGHHTVSKLSGCGSDWRGRAFSCKECAREDSAYQRTDLQGKPMRTGCRFRATLLELVPPPSQAPPELSCSGRGCSSRRAWPVNAVRTHRLPGGCMWKTRGGGAYSGNAQEEREEVRADTAPVPPFATPVSLRGVLGKGGGPFPSPPGGAHRRMGGRKGEGARVRERGCFRPSRFINIHSQHTAWVNCSV